MRQGQQNRRGRGRNRKNQNPLSRSFESNGPDVKIRGTPAHIAEKYLSLARDALSSGDPVLAENYMQHAEHYSRIIMAYREQMQPPGEGYNGNGQQRMRGPGEGGDDGDYGEDDGDDMLDESGFPQPASFQPPPHQHGQSRQHGGGYEHSRHDNNNRHDRPFRRDHGRFRDRDRNSDRQGDRGERQSFENRPQPAVDRSEAQAADAAGAPEQMSRRRERFPSQAHEQPEFLRRPVRRARSDEDAPEGGKDERD